MTYRSPAGTDGLSAGGGFSSCVTVVYRIKKVNRRCDGIGNNINKTDIDIYLYIVYI